MWGSESDSDENVQDSEPPAVASLDYQPAACSEMSTGMHLPPMYVLADSKVLEMPLIQWLQSNFQIGCSISKIRILSERLTRRFCSVTVIPSLDSVTTPMTFMELWNAIFMKIPDPQQPDYRCHFLFLLCKLSCYFWTTANDLPEQISEPYLNQILFKTRASMEEAEKLEQEQRTQMTSKTLASKLCLMFGMPAEGYLKQELLKNIKKKKDMDKVDQLTEKARIHQIWCTEKFDTVDSLRAMENPVEGDSVDPVTHFLKQKCYFGRAAVERSWLIEMTLINLIDGAFKYFNISIETVGVLIPKEFDQEQSLRPAKCRFLLSNILTKAYDNVSNFTDLQTLCNDPNYDKAPQRKTGIVNNPFVTSVNFSDNCTFHNMLDCTAEQRLLCKILDKLQSKGYRRLGSDVFTSVFVNIHESEPAKVCTCTKCGVWNRKHTSQCSMFTQGSHSKVVCETCYRDRDHHPVCGDHAFKPLTKAMYADLCTGNARLLDKVKTYAFKRKDTVDSVVRQICNKRTESGMWNVLTAHPKTIGVICKELIEGQYLKFPEVKTDKRFISTSNGIMDLRDPSTSRPYFYSYRCHCRYNFQEAAPSELSLLPCCLRACSDGIQESGVPLKSVRCSLYDRRDFVYDLELENSVFVESLVPNLINGYSDGKEYTTGHRICVWFAGGKRCAWYTVKRDQSSCHMLMDVQLEMSQIFQLVHRICTSCPAFYNQGAFFCSFLDESNTSTDRLRDYVPVDLDVWSTKLDPVAFVQSATKLVKLSTNVKRFVDIVHVVSSFGHELYNLQPSSIETPDQGRFDTDLWKFPFLDDSNSAEVQSTYRTALFERVEAYPLKIDVQLVDSSLFQLKQVPESWFYIDSMDNHHHACMECFDNPSLHPQRNLENTNNLVTRNFLPFIMEMDRVLDVTEGTVTPRRDRNVFRPKCPPASNYALCKVNGEVRCRHCNKLYRLQPGQETKDQMCVKKERESLPCDPWIIPDCLFHRDIGQLTPLFANLYAHQNLVNASFGMSLTNINSVPKRTQHVLATIYMLIGRLFFQVNEHDKWHLAVFNKGIGGTGKSVTLSTVQLMFPAKRINLVSDNCQKDFTGLDEHAWVVLSGEFGRGTNRSRIEFQQMVSGDPMTLNKKHKPAVSIECWTSQQFLCGNDHPDWTDSGNQINRRLAVIPFDCPVDNKNDSLPGTIAAQELGYILYTSLFAYDWFSDVYQMRSTHFWNFCPDLFLKTRDLAAKEDNMRCFVMSENLVVTKGAFIPLTDFKNLYKSWCSENNRKQDQAWGPDLVREVFARHNISQKNKQLQYPPEDLPAATLSQFRIDGGIERKGTHNYLFGVGLASMFGTGKKGPEAIPYTEEDCLDQLLSETCRRVREGRKQPKVVLETLMKQIHVKLLDKVQAVKFTSTEPQSSKRKGSNMMSSQDKRTRTSKTIHV